MGEHFCFLAWKNGGVWEESELEFGSSNSNRFPFVLLALGELLVMPFLTKSKLDKKFAENVKTS